jgi:hypothetical protein
VQYYKLTAILTVSILLFAIEKFNAHPIDIHLPIAEDFLLEYEYHKQKAIQEAEDTLSDPDSTQEERNKATEHLFSDKGNRI